jgi:hypothetical protein
MHDQTIQTQYTIETRTIPSLNHWKGDIHFFRKQGVFACLNFTGSSLMQTIDSVAKLKHIAVKTSTSSRRLNADVHIV